MALQNRVTPWGQLERTPARGTLLGNRGILHNERREIIRHHRGTLWIACQLNFKGRKRELMAPRRYTELFFLDEAVSLAAGHRPCGECRRDRYKAFVQAWGAPTSPREIDRILHSARLSSPKDQSRLDTLPTGTFLEYKKSAYLLWNGALHLWSHDGYAKLTEPLPPDTIVTFLTPAPTLRCLRNGYVPSVHPSAE